MPDTLTASPPQTAANTRQAKLLDLLEDLFMLKHEDLDFGIYRVMNTKRAEIARFLDHDLLPGVRAALGTPRQAGRQEMGTADPAAAEAEVFSHLYQFFRRYYHEGDFLSLRRYKEGVYAIPYEGEEVKLHWANADQYYIKTGEYFRDYTFTLPDERRVHFQLADADTERGNNKAAAGQERRFVLAEDEPVAEEDGELTVRFTYRTTENKTKQTVLNEAAEAEILRAASEAWRSALATKAPTEKDATRRLLAKHLADYTARNTFDYFIHKDLGGFLRRELDFYLKNEVMHLDDIESESAPRVEQYVAKLRAVRRIGHKILDFLAQLEDFQKRLWLKRKFVVETKWCATLDRVPEALYAEIAANDAQRAEWVRLFAIDELDGYAAPLTPDFLRANPFLVLDTRFFDRAFTDRLLASEEILGDADSLDDATDGLLVHSENFQALTLLQERYREQVQCIYIDPPYNTGNDGFAYKDQYRHSSWITMMRDRLLLGKAQIGSDGLLFCSCDSTEHHRLRLLADEVFGPAGFVESFSWIRAYNPSNLSKKTRQKSEYVLCYQAGQSSQPFRGTPLEDQDSQPLYNAANARGRLRFPTGSVTFGFDEAILEAGEYGKGPVVLERAVTVKGGTNRGPVLLKGPFRWRQATLEKELERGTTIRIATRSLQPRFKRAVTDNHRTPDNLLIDKTVGIGSNEEARGELEDRFGALPLDYPKPTSLVKYLAGFRSTGSEVVLDYFAGSGTTGHAVIDLNREDGGRRKYILVEMGEYFDTVLKPRIQKVVYSRDWKDGKPVGREGSSQLFKTLRLESYEDTLNNLALARTPEQQELLDAEPDFREDYTLRYMLDVESRGSQSLLNLARFDDPFRYTLRIATGSAGETRESAVDLIETFNYLLGLRVKHMDHIRGVRVVQGASPEGERVLVLWRNIAEVPSDALNDWFRKQGYNPRDQEWDVVYVNGDNHLENLRRPDQTWKVRLTEEEFSRRMWDVREV